MKLSFAYLLHSRANSTRVEAGTERQENIKRFDQADRKLRILDLPAQPAALPPQTVERLSLSGAGLSRSFFVRLSLRKAGVDSGRKP
jgi:hypothetical protein